MANSGLSTTLEELRDTVSAFLGYGPTPAADRLAEIDTYIRAGLNRFYYPPAVQGTEAGYSWSFLKPIGTLTTAIAAAAQDLPDALERVVGDFYYAEADHRRSVPQVSEERYRALLSRSEDAAQPQVCRVRHKLHDANKGKRMEVAWWPIPDAAYVLTYHYEANSDPLDENNRYPLGGALHAELLTQSCLAVAEQRANDERGIQTAEFERQLIPAIQRDRTLSARVFGHMGSFEVNSRRPNHGDTSDPYPLTYNGADVT